jgi:Metallo-peptidase family M12B Reprolysin-like
MRLISLIIVLLPAFPVLAAANPFSGFPAEAVQQLPGAERHALVADANSFALSIAGERRQLLVRGTELNPSGNRTLRGTVTGGGRFLITQGKDHALGLIETGGRRLRLFASPEGAWLADETAPGLQRGGLAGDVSTLAAGDTARPSRSPRASAVDTRIVDMMFLYTPLMLDRYGAPGLDLLWDQEVALANLSFANSGVNVVLRRVDDRQVDYPEAIDNFQLIADMYWAGVAGSGNAFDASLNFLAAARQTVGADIVSMWRTHDLNTRGTCGIAQLGGFGGSVDPRDGVQANMDGMHGGSVCDSFVFVHETGHNLGAGHNDGSGTDAWSHGFGKADRYTTMMWSAGTGDPNRFLTLNYFSNPDITCGGDACGIAAGLAGESDNADTIDRIATDVAAYVAAQSLVVVTAPAPDPGDSDGDGIDDDLDEFPFDATEDTDTDGDGVGDVADDFPTDAAETTDTDGDGTGDAADTDDDDDGTPDTSDAFPLDASETADLDSDGFGDNVDLFDTSNREFADTDGDGVGNRVDDDDDGDGTPDFATPNNDVDVEVIVATEGDDLIRTFLGSTGEARETLIAMPAGSIHFRSDMTIGPGGDLYFIAGSSVYRLDRVSGAALQELIRFTPATHGSAFPTTLLADRIDLYVAEIGQQIIYQYETWSLNIRNQAAGRDLRSATFLGNNFYVIDWNERSVWVYQADLTPNGRRVAAGVGGMVDPSDMVIGPPSSNIYITSAGTDEVLRYDRFTGEFMDAFVTAGSGGLDEPSCLAFLPSAEWLVCSRGTGEVLRYAANGAFIDVFLSAADLGGGLPVSMLVTPRTLAPGETSSDPVFDTPPPNQGQPDGGSSCSTCGGSPFGLVSALVLICLIQVSARRLRRSTLR